MLPDRVSNPGPLTYESGALPIALRGPAPNRNEMSLLKIHLHTYLNWISQSVYHNLKILI